MKLSWLWLAADGFLACFGFSSFGGLWAAGRQWLRQEKRTKPRKQAFFCFFKENWFENEENEWSESNLFFFIEFIQ